MNSDQKEKEIYPWLGWISRLPTLLVELQLDARLWLAWSHYITYSLQLSSVMACFMWPDSPYIDVVVNTCCHCLNKNFPIITFIRINVLPDIFFFLSWYEQSSANVISPSSRGSSEALIWHLKTLNMVEWIQMHSLTEVMETWTTASSYKVLYYFRAILTWSGKFKILLPWINCSIQNKKKNHISH